MEAVDIVHGEEAVEIVHGYVKSTPEGDPAKLLLENLVTRAATCAGFREGELLNIPAGRRRNYHDDVTVIVVVCRSKQRKSKASTHLDQVR